MRCTVRARPKHWQHHSISFTFVWDGRCIFSQGCGSRVLGVTVQHFVLMMRLTGKENTLSSIPGWRAITLAFMTDCDTLKSIVPACVGFLRCNTGVMAETHIAVS